MGADAALGAISAIGREVTLRRSRGLTNPEARATMERMDRTRTRVRFMFASIERFPSTILFYPILVSITMVPIIKTSDLSSRLECVECVSSGRLDDVTVENRGVRGREASIPPHAFWPRKEDRKKGKQKGVDL
jgi:hypothetical protein